MLLTDELADRIHRLHMHSVLGAAKGAVKVVPGAAWREVGGGLASFTGEGSPITQVCEFGYRTSEVDVGEIEEFYAGRCENWELTLTPFSSPEAFRAVSQAGYRPDHFESTLVRLGEAPMALDPAIEIEEVTGDLSEWMETAERGWAESEDALVSDTTRIIAATDGVRHYLARVDGIPAATASLIVHNDTAAMAGAATRVPFRGRGIQNALIARRLRDAGPNAVVTMSAMPGSQSHRNAQRHGFAPMYSVLVFMRR